MIAQILLTPVPFSMAVEKLRGFVADHRATIVKIEGNRMELEIIDNGSGRRYADRAAAFRLELRFEEERLQRGTGEHAGNILRTRIHAAISPRRGRDRRCRNVVERARQVLASLGSYLMATKEEESVVPLEGAIVRAKRILMPWWKGT